VDELLRFQSRQVDAGRRWADVGHDGEFGAGSCMAVHQAAQDAGTRRLRDSGSNPR